MRQERRRMFARQQERSAAAGARRLGKVSVKDRRRWRRHRAGSRLPFQDPRLPLCLKATARPHRAPEDVLAAFVLMRELIMN